MAPEDQVEPSELTLLQRIKKLDSMLLFIMFYMACCAFNYGVDVGVFGGVQGMQSFACKFGEFNENTGVCALSATLASELTATPFLGKAVGCIMAGWFAEKYGRRIAILAMCILSFVGVVLQVSSTTAAQFAVGRVITYGMTGMAIVVVPIYQAETAPKVLRGMFNSTIQLLIVFGQVVASLITYGTKNIPSKAGWQIPVGIQLVTPAIILVLLPLLPESPRWLLSQDRREDAAKSLRRLRKKATEEEVNLEIEAILYANSTEHKGSWSELFNKDNRVRTWVAILAMWGQQITGQAFPSQYSVIFYQSQGFGDRSFLFSVGSSLISLGGVIITWLWVDGLGRRPALLVGGSFMAIWLFILGGVGSIQPQSSINVHEKNLIVTSIMMFSFFYNISWAPVPFVVVSEAANSRIKEKTNLLACVVSVITTFVVSFTVPYLINDKYANLGSKVGFVYGSTNVMMVVLTFFFIPELKGRTLEEIDQLFESDVPLRKFASVKTKTAEELYTQGVDHKLTGVSTEVRQVEVQA